MYVFVIIIFVIYVLLSYIFIIHIIPTILEGICPKTPVHSKVNRSYLRVLTLTTHSTIHVQINTFFDGLRKGLIDMVKCTSIME